MMELTCEGKTAEFMYDRVHQSAISLQTIAKEILESTGRQIVNERDLFFIQTNYPSLRNLLEDYLVKGEWIPPGEAEQIDVIGYPSKQSSIEEAFGLDVLKKGLDNQKGQVSRRTRKKSPTFRPRRRR